MSRTVKISGIITSAETDEAYFASWIERGVITPESRFTRQLAAAKAAGEDVVVEVNSYGGDVVSGNQMLAALQDFPNGKRVVVGAFAASMAANIVLQAGCPVDVHENTIMLFHSARSIMEGGPQALEDEAKLLDQMNGPVKARLVALGVPADEVEAGFAEGRQFTLGAQDLVKYGIAQAILPGASPLPQRPADDNEDAKALRLAAYYGQIDEKPASDEGQPAEEPPAEPAEPAAGPDTEPAEPAAPPEDPPAEPEPEPEPAPSEPEPSQEALDRLAAEFNKRLSGLQAAKDREIAALKNDLASAVEDRDEALAMCKQLGDEATAAEAALADLRKQFAKLQAAHVQLTGGALRTTPDADVTSKAEAKKVLASLPMSKRAAYYQEHKALLG